MREIVNWPADVLETRASDVNEFDDEIKNLSRDLHETMEHAGGIGLAANQVGVLMRVLAIRIPFSMSEDEDDQRTPEWWHDRAFTFVNPVITKKAGKLRYQEGCLSFPDIFDYVDRAAEVWVSAKDECGDAFDVHATGLFAVCLQHEIDHLDGIVFINRMSRLKAGLIRKKILRRGRLEQAELA